MIPYGRQSVSEEDIEAVVEVLRSDFLTQGPKVSEFENTLCRYTGAEYSIAVNSATSALHLSCMALDLGAGDILWTSAVTFVASANCAFYCGATVDLIDIDPATYNLNVNDLEKKLEHAKASGRLPKIIVAVHMAGQPCEMKAIKALADRYQVSLIEDASHAIGATYQNGKVGACAYSDLTVFSFHPVKIVTSGEGGAVLTNNKQLAKRVELLRSHGVTRDVNDMVNTSEGDWYYEQVSLGFNYRITDIHAALGISQTKRLDEFVARRNHIAQSYNQAFSDLPLKLPKVANGNISAWHLYIVRLDLEQIHADRKQVFDALRANGLHVNVHYIPLYKQPYFIEKLGVDASRFPEAEQYYKEALTLPLYPSMSQADIDCVIETVGSVIGSFKT